MKPFKGKKWILRVLAAVYVMPILYVIIDIFLFGWLGYRLHLSTESIGRMTMLGNVMFFFGVGVCTYLLLQEDRKALSKLSLFRKILRVVVVSLSVIATFSYVIGCWFVYTWTAPVSTFEVHDPQGNIYVAQEKKSQEKKSRETYYQIVEKRLLRDRILGWTGRVVSSKGRSPTRFLVYDDKQPQVHLYCLDIQAKVLFEPKACEDSVTQQPNMNSTGSQTRIATSTLSSYIPASCPPANTYPEIRTEGQYTLIELGCGDSNWSFTATLVRGASLERDIVAFRISNQDFIWRTFNGREHIISTIGNKPWDSFQDFGGSNPVTVSDLTLDGKPLKIVKKPFEYRDGALGALQGATFVPNQTYSGGELTVNGVRYTVDFWKATVAVAN